MDVYTATPVVARLPVAITSVAALGDALYVGGEDGSLRRAVAVAEPAAAAAAAPRFEVVETNAKFNRDKKPVRGLHAVPEWGLLLSVCGACGAGVAALQHTRLASLAAASCPPPPPTAPRRLLRDALRARPTSRAAAPLPSPTLPQTAR